MSISVRKVILIFLTIEELWPFSRADYKKKVLFLFRLALPHSIEMASGSSFWLDLVITIVHTELDRKVKDLPTFPYFHIVGLSLASGDEKCIGQAHLAKSCRYQSV